MKYRVRATMTISVWTEVDAKNAAHAKVVAEQRDDVINLCIQCSGGDPTSEWVTSGELDGSPTKLKVEPA